MKGFHSSLERYNFQKRVALLCCISLLAMVLVFNKLMKTNLNPYEHNEKFWIVSYGNNDVLKSYSKIIFSKAANDSVIIAVTACGKQVVEQTLVMLKSAVIFSSSFIHFIIMADDIKEILCEQIMKWPQSALNRISFEIRTTSYPNVTQAKQWKYAFRPCSSQRLFYPILLTEYDTVLHIDSDAIFLSPVDELWNITRKMNSTQIAALATEDMNRNTSWYLNNKVGPYATKYGVNAGIMLMYLTRMRQFKFFNKLEPIVYKYKHLLPWFDQDVINVYFNAFPQQLYELQCRWNFLTDHCISGPLCESAHRHGIALLHGSRNSFHTAVHPVFRAIYIVFRNYKFDSDLNENLLIPINVLLKSLQNTNCGKAHKIFTHSIERFLENY